MVGTVTAHAWELETESAPLALAVVGAGDQSSSRLRGVIAAAGLRHAFVSGSDVRTASHPDAVMALVVVRGHHDWPVLSAAIQRLDTIALVSEPSAIGAQHALSIGAVGYLGLSLPDATLTKAIRAIVRGEAGFSRSVLGHWLRGSINGSRPIDAQPLTQRQQEILDRIAHGDTDRQIAMRLGIATTTVHKHVRNLLARLHVANRAAAVAYARRRTPTG